MGGVRGVNQHQNSMEITVIDELPCYVATVAVKDQEAVLSPCFGLSKAIKDLFKPSKACLVVGPASRR